jgi:hypothetical protein
LSGEGFVKMKPFYRGYKGKLVHCSEAADPFDTYKSHGIAEIINRFSGDGGAQYSTIQISELPVASWTENYKKYLMDLEEAEQIENVNNMSSDIDVAFTFDVMHKDRPSKKKGGGRKANSNNANTSESASGSTSPQRATAKKFKKKIYFGGTLDEVFLKDIKMILHFRVRIWFCLMRMRRLKNMRMWSKYCKNSMIVDYECMALGRRHCCLRWSTL